MTPHPEAFAAIGAATAPAFSRDGQTLFHLRGSGLPQVWALDLATGASRQLTFHDEKVALLRRSPLDDRLIYGIDRGGDERQQLLLIDPQGASPEPRELTLNAAVIHDFGAWSPDAARIAYAANERDEAHFDVYVQDVASGVRECAFRGSNQVSVSGFRSDGARLALLHDRGFGDVSLLVLDPASGEARALGSPSNFRSVRWASDGRTLLALTDHGDTNFLRLCGLDPDSGDVSVVYEAAGRDVEAWSIASDACSLATIENDRGYAVLRVGSIDGERPVVTGLPRGIVTDLTWSADSTTLAFSVAAPTEPPSLWLWRDGAARVAWRPEPPPGLGDFVDLELVSWQSFDGTHVAGWFALPRGPQPADGYPAVMWVHGGPVGQTRPNFRPDIQMLLAQGFAILMPNVRGSSGYGRTYTKSDDVERRLDSVTDLAHGRHWLAAHPAIDGERIAIMGQSYGGFMVMSAITEHPELWRAAVNYYGIADFASLLAGTGAWRRSHRAAEYGDPERDAELFARISPIHRVDRIRAPVLIAHGTRDPRVPIGESEQFVAALQERQKKVAYETFDYAGHGFIRPDDKGRIYTAVADFFTTHLR
ncbi:MAG TPA: S9 family peptidase [Acetobacteraceae bacterium]|jgi:dipeptidyl aminopeptidase/acylaminoacyl peptidase